jgi:segregation and condensation protein B
MARLANTIEAILYLKAKPLTIGQIAEYAGCDRDTAEEGLIELMGDYAHREGALEIAETEEGYSLQLKPPYRPLLDQLIPLDIGLGALRTLAAIAIRGPISQTDLVELRGSGAYQHVPELVDQGFVRKRRQSDGRSYWLQVTEKFYQRFEIDKLPQIAALKASPEPDEDEVEEEASAIIENGSIQETSTDPNPLAAEEGVEERLAEETEPLAPAESGQAEIPEI